MLSISVEEFLFWKKKQLSKGGDQQSFAVLLDCIGGISTSDLNLKSINPRDNLHLKKNLEFLESIWGEHLLKSCPIQYLCGITFWRDLKLKVTDKVLIPRPETELIVDIVFKIFRKQSQKLTFAELGTGSGAISIALSLAISNTSWSISVAIPSHNGYANDKAILIAPEPVPNSAKNNFFDCFPNILNTISTMSSVSGLGISTLSVTFNFKSLQKVIPQRYWMGKDCKRCWSQMDSKKAKFFFRYK